MYDAIISRKPVSGDRSIFKALYPGGASDAGFLAIGENLDDVIVADADTLEDLGITHLQVADRLEYVMGRAKRLAYEKASDKDYWKLVESGIPVGDLRVTYVSYMGYQDCPWECNAQEDHYAKSGTDFTITSPRGKIFASQLHVHLIRKHMFFEGHTGYRLDPAAAVSVLDLKPGTDYKPVYRTEKMWSSTQMSCGMPLDYYLEQTMTNQWASSNKEIVEKGEDIAIGATKMAKLYKDKIYVLTDEDIPAILSINDMPLPRITSGLTVLGVRELSYVEE